MAWIELAADGLVLVVWLTLVIESASAEPLEFADIPDVERVHSLLYQEVADDS